MRCPASAALAAVLLAATWSGDVSAQDYMPALGGPGGGQFVTRCPEGALLHGFELRTADDVDAMRPVCVYAQGPNRFSGAAADSRWHGTDGGQFVSVVCPDRWPIVIGIEVQAEGVDTVIVNKLSLDCGWASVTQPADLPTNEKPGFYGPSYMPTQTRYGFGFGSEGKWATGNRGTEACPPGHVAVGVWGRSGIWLDAMGLICDEPKTYMTLGRVNTGSAPAGPPMSLCDRARDARARNSPAAPNLEAQCRASQPPVKSIGRVNRRVPGLSGTTLETIPAAVASPTPARTTATASTNRTALPPRPPICDAARDARARNSPAAPNLEAQCRALGGTP